MCIEFRRRVGLRDHIRGADPRKARDKDVAAYVLPRVILETHHRHITQARFIATGVLHAHQHLAAFGLEYFAVLAVVGNLQDPPSGESSKQMFANTDHSRYHCRDELRRMLAVHCARSSGGAPHSRGRRLKEESARAAAAGCTLSVKTHCPLASRYLYAVWAGNGVQSVSANAAAPKQRSL